MVVSMIPISNIHFPCACNRAIDYHPSPGNSQKLLVAPTTEALCVIQWHRYDSYYKTKKKHCKSLFPNPTLKIQAYKTGFKLETNNNKTQKRLPDFSRDKGPG